MSSKEAWLLNEHGYHFGLFYHAANNTLPPITLSTSLPDGSYRVSVLLESLNNISLLPDQIGFLFRFDGQSPFMLPNAIEPVTGQGKPYAYLDLGMAKVDNNNFSVEVSFILQDNGPYVIRHIRFDPAKSPKVDTSERPTEEEALQQMEKLKSLGYL